MPRKPPPKRKASKRTWKDRRTRAASSIDQLIQSRIDEALDANDASIRLYVDEALREKFTKVAESNKRVKAAVQDIMRQLDKLERILRKLK